MADNGSPSRRTIRTWDAGTMFGPRLIVTYVDPGTPPPSPPPSTNWAVRFADYTAVLAPAETGTVMLLAADRRQARTLMPYIVGMLDAVPCCAGSW